ncbi:uncharacterized protein LOC126336608 isoform X1 [Schistocerca gregaria]|uniref:uncharacterized protein LOC126336608 isoform X1 n=1 Tax=Schistocerca gregaria TaxID=7010 RepID=UPI00211F03D3|nr:uncharacterized protein LOC126336608 isoform X1 [Schistocerca gregaria]
MGLGPSLQLKPIEDRSELASRCPVRACRDAETSRFASLPTDAGCALSNGLLTVHTAVTAATGMTQLKQLPAHWLQVTEDIMRRVHEQRSAIAVDLAHRLEEAHPEFRCKDEAPNRAFPRYWSCGVLLDNYLSLALGEMPPRFHLHIDHLKLQDIRETFVDVVANRFPEVMDKNKKCILKIFLKLANDILNAIERGEEIGKDDVTVEVTEDDPEFPPPDKKVYWFPPPTIDNRCGGQAAGKCPHMFCEYRSCRPHIFTTQPK